MNIFREIILDSEPEPRCIDWPVVLIVAWFAAAAWVLMSYRVECYGSYGTYRAMLVEEEKPEPEVLTP